MRPYYPIAVWAVSAFALAGCKTCDLVEAELRYQTRRVRELERCVCQKQAEIDTLQAMLGDRSDKAAPNAKIDTAEDIYRRTALSKVTLGPGTGGRDLDRDGFNEAVQFTVVCLDYDGDAFKCPGEARLELLAYNDLGSQESVGHWTFAPEELRQLWKSSMLGSGYQMIVPISARSAATKWHFHVRFTTLDGRTFEDGRDVTMKVAPPPTGTLPCDLPADATVQDQRSQRLSSERLARTSSPPSTVDQCRFVSTLVAKDSVHALSYPPGATSARLLRPIPIQP